MNIRTQQEFIGWSAVDADRWEPGGQSPEGFGSTEAEAIIELMGRIADHDERMERRRAGRRRGADDRDPGVAPVCQFRGQPCR